MWKIPWLLCVYNNNYQWDGLRLNSSDNIGLCQKPKMDVVFFYVFKECLKLDQACPLKIIFISTLVIANQSIFVKWQTTQKYNFFVFICLSIQNIIYLSFSVFLIMLSSFSFVFNSSLVSCLFLNLQLSPFNHYLSKQIFSRHFFTPSRNKAQGKKSFKSSVLEPV